MFVGDMPCGVASFLQTATAKTGLATGAGEVVAARWVPLNGPAAPWAKKTHRLDNLSQRAGIWFWGEGRREMFSHTNDRDRREVLEGNIGGASVVNAWNAGEV